MLDIGWTELLVIGIVALIVVGPKDLPVMFHNLGKFTGRMRTMAREFTRAMDDAAQSAGTKDLARDLRSMTNPTAAGKRALKKATGLDALDDPFGDGESDDSGETADKAPDTSSGTPGAAHGPNTAQLAMERNAAAKARRQEAVARANARAASYAASEGRAEEATADAAPVPAPAPGAEAPDAAPARDRAQDTA